MNWIKRIWKFSRLRFYLLNLSWNYKFWLNAKPYYVTKNFVHTDEVLDLDKNLDSLNLKFEFDKKRGIFKRFVGYYYNGGLYLDNPGIQNVEYETKLNWIRKGWI